MCVWFSVCVVLDQRAHNAASSTHTNAQCVSETNRTRCLFRFNTTLSHCHSRCLVTQTYKHNFRSRMFFFYFSPNASTHTYSKPMCPIPMRESVTHTESDRECVSESGNDGGKKTPKTHVLTKGSLSFSCNRLADTFVYSIIGAHSRSESVVSGKWSDSIHNGRKRKRAREVSLSNTHAHKCTDVKVHNPIHFSLYTHISPCVFISID